VDWDEKEGGDANAAKAYLNAFGPEEKLSCRYWPLDISV
jgi:hypothetical protein